MDIWTRRWETFLDEVLEMYSNVTVTPIHDVTIDDVITTSTTEIVLNTEENIVD